MRRKSQNTTIDLTDSLKKRLLSWASAEETFIWLDSNASEAGESKVKIDKDAILAVGSARSINTSSNDGFNKLSDFRKKVDDYVFGYLSYDLKNEIEALESSNEDHLDFPELYFFQPKKIFIWKGRKLSQLYLEPYANEMRSDLEEILESEEKFKYQKALNIKSRIDKDQYTKKVQNILDHIHRGDVYEVNFCQEFYAENSGVDPVRTFLNLNKLSAAPFACFLRHHEQYLLCSSPERFAKKTGVTLLSQPIKGTARRSKNIEEDRQIVAELAKDEKERSENIMIVDLVRNDLSKHALQGSVKVEELCEIYTFKQVHQMISTISAEVEQSVDPVSLIRDLFPMGSMTGAPKISAMNIIDEEEVTKRGMYSGAVGYFAPNGDFDFNVVIRSILYNALKKYVSFSVGSAITSLSDIDKEYSECLLKAAALKQVLQ